MMMEEMAVTMIEEKKDVVTVNGGPIWGRVLVDTHIGFYQKFEGLYGPLMLLYYNPLV